MPITHEGTVPGNLTMDRGHIYIKIWDSAGNLFGYGEQVITETVKEYQIHRPYSQACHDDHRGYFQPVRR